MTKSRKKFDAAFKAVRACEEPQKVASWASAGGHLENVGSYLLFTQGAVAEGRVIWRQFEWSQRPAQEAPDSCWERVRTCRSGFGTAHSLQ